MSPFAWARAWHVRGETPKKERNANGRMAWPARFKLLPVTRGKLQDDDVALVIESGLARRLAAAQALADSLSDILDRAADSDVDYGPDHAVTIARTALAAWEQTR